MKWIPVTERLPETSGKYLTTSSDYHKVGHGWYNNKYNPGWEDDKENHLPVTHWMLLPPSPDESEVIGERKFTLKEMEDAFDAGVSRGESYVNGWGYENNNGCSTEYFKDKFGIDI